MLHGDPNRVYSPHASEAAARGRQPASVVPAERDPTLLNPQDGNPFSGG
jgi:hypothetical protein